MNTIRLFHFLVILIFMTSYHVLAQPAAAPQTFCNPLNLNYRFMVDAIDAREAADPVIVIYKDEYYLFASRSGGYWTSPDLRTWSLIVPQVIDMESYAPAVIVMRDTIFYFPSSATQIYKTTDPKSGVWEKGPVYKGYSDPALFLDDDGRLYMCYGVSNVNPTSIVELDPVTFKEIGSKIDVVSAQADIHGWERRGDNNLLDEEPWIEGSWMVKWNNKYYLHYAGPGTEYKTYGDGIYVAESPMGPYEYAPYSPFSFKPTGFITGAGHGCTFKDKNGQYWHIGTMTVSIRHMFERRLGLSPVGFDEDGHIHANNYLGDYPQYFPGINDNPDENNFAGMMLLSHKKYVMASSSMEDYGVGNAVDEEVRTYWSAQSGEPGEWIMVDLGKECSIEAVQINFGEHNTNVDIVRGRDNLLYQQYILEVSSDGMNWSVLVDNSQNMSDVPHDYIELEEAANARYVKLINVFTPGEGNFAVRGLRVFGNKDLAVFTPVNDFTVERSAIDGRDAYLRWTPVENANGYIISYGVAPDKLYNNFMVYDADTLDIHSLNHGVDYYFNVEAFDNGTDYYSPVGEIQSFQSGNWNDVNSWAQFNGTEWVNPAPELPSVSGKPITILNGHIITVTESDSASRLNVNFGGELIIGKDVSFRIKNAIETDLLVEGRLQNYGSVTSDPLATISFSGNGIYAHKQDGGSIPMAIWRPNSTVSIDTLVSNVPSNMNQDFYNVVWDCEEQESDMNLNWNGNTIGGNIQILNTGAFLQMCDPVPGEKTVVTIKGDFILEKGLFTTNNSDKTNTDITINHYGNIDIRGGAFSLSKGNQGGSGITKWNTFGNISLANAIVLNANTGGAKIVLKNTKARQLLSTIDVVFDSGGFPLEVDSGSALDMGSNILQGSGSFNLKAGATLITARQEGIDGCIANTGVKTFHKAANFEFNGSSQQFTGFSLPDTVNNLLINNSANIGPVLADISLSNSVLVNGSLDMRKGYLSLNGKTLKYGANGSLIYSGTVAQTTTDAEFPATGGPQNLIVANSKGLSLNSSRTISNLELNYKLLLGPHNLVVNSISKLGASAFVSTADGGTLTFTSVGGSQVLFPVGTTVYSPVWVANQGVADDISIGVIKDEESPYGGNIKLKWNIGEAISGGGNYSLKFSWTTAVESAAFKLDRLKNAKIISLSDTTEAGTGVYTTQFAKQPYSVERGGIANLGPFGIGTYSWPTGLKTKRASSFTLSQNYPNPFSSSTMIGFEIPEKSFVNLTVHNILGEQVAELAGKEFQPGNHSLTFYAPHLAKGTYFYTLKVNDFSQTKMMMLTK